MREIIEKIKKCLHQIECELAAYKELENDIKQLRLIQEKVDEEYKYYENEHHERYKMVYDIINKNK